MKISSHELANKPQNMTYEERVENMSKLNPNPRKGIDPNKLFENGASVGDIYNLMVHGDGIRKYEYTGGRPFSYESVEEFDKQVLSYFEYCQEKQLMPARPGLALWLGIDSDTLNKWKKDPTNLMHESIKRAEEAMHMFTLQKAGEGKINPILYFFIAKNWYGMQDKTEIVHKSSSTQAIDITEQQRILRNTPGVVLDAEFEEKPNIGDLDTEDLEKALSGR